MAFSDNKITAADLTGKGVTGMADTPNLTTAQMQQKLDEIAKEVIPPKFNALCDDLDATDFASIITSKSTDKMLFQRLNEYDQMEYSVDNVNWSLIASGKEVLDPTLEADNAKKLGGQLPSFYQKTTDNNLPTTDKTTSGAIAEIKTGLDNVDTTANEAPTYNATLTYAVGDYVSYEKHIYKCNTAIETAEAWNATHWTQTTLGAEIETVNNSLTTVDLKVGDTSYIANTTYSDIVKLIQYWQSKGELSDPTELIPLMTSNTTPSGVASASTEFSGHPAWHAFDSAIWDTGWISGVNDPTPYIQYQFTSPRTCKKLCIGMNNVSMTTSPKFKLQGSSNGSTFVDLTDYIDIPSPTTIKKVIVNNNTSYSYYRIVFDQVICTSSGTFFPVNKVQLCGN